jgi:hypothetical protein
LPRVIVAEPHPRRSSSDFILQNLPPRIGQAPRSESIRLGDFKATMKSKCNAFKKGVKPMTPPSHVHNGPGFHPWMSALGENTMPPAGKAAPSCVTIIKAFAQDPTVHHLQRRCPAAPRKPHQMANDAPVARGSRTAASAATPSDQAAHGTRPDSTAHVTPLHVEAVTDHRQRHWHWHPPPSLLTYCQQPRGAPHHHGLRPLP